MTDGRFIKRFVEKAEFLLEDIAMEMQEEYEKEISGVILKCSKKEFERALRLLEEINEASKKIVIAGYSAKTYEISVKRKYCQS